MVNVGKALADALPVTKPGLQLRQGVVTAFDAPTYTVTLNVSNDLDSITISDIPYLESYTPIVGDTVWLFRNGTDLIVLGVLSSVVDRLPLYSTLAGGFGTVPSTTAEVRQTGLSGIAVTLPSGHLFKAVCEGRSYTSSPVTHGDVILRGISGGTVAAAGGGTLIRKHAVFLSGTGDGQSPGFHFEGLFTVSTTGTYTIGLYLERTGASSGGDFRLSASDFLSLWVEDLGPSTNALVVQIP